MVLVEEFLYRLRFNAGFLSAAYFFVFAFGIFAFYSSSSFLFGLVFTVFAVIFLILASIFKKIENVIPFSFIFCLYLLFIAGFLNAKVHFTEFDELSKIESIQDAKIFGYVCSMPKYNAKTNVYKFQLKPYEIEIENKKYEVSKSKILVSVKDDEDFKIEYADNIIVMGSLTTPLGAFNPSQFDYKKFLQNKGILKTLYTQGSNYEILKTTNKNFKRDFTKRMYEIRDWVIKKHSRYIKSPKLELLGGVVFGDEAVASADEVTDSFINSGLLHLLAASGLNVAFILSMWLMLVYFLNIPYRLKIISGMFVVFLYTIMTGFPPSVVRASVMMGFILFGKLIYRQAKTMPLVFGAGFLILLFKPNFFYDVGFELSFLVTLGLAFCLPCTISLFDKKEKRFINKINNYPKIIKKVLSIFSPVSIAACFIVPLTAQLWAGPLQAHYFNTFSTYSIIANACVVPFIGIVSSLGFLSTAVCFIPFISDYILYPLDFILNIVIQIVLNISNFFAGLPNSLIKVSAPSFFNILVFYIFIALIFYSLKLRFKKKILNISSLICLLILGLQFINFDLNKTEILFFDVQNGDNCLIKTAKNKYIMIDTGRYVYNGISTAKTITLKYLYDKNIRQIDTLILTHFDSDHAGGLLDILQNVKVKNLVAPELECNSKISCNIKEYIEKNNINYIEAYTGQSFSFDENTTLINYIPYTNYKGCAASGKCYNCLNKKTVECGISLEDENSNGSILNDMLNKNHKTCNMENSSKNNNLKYEMKNCCNKNNVKNCLNLPKRPTRNDTSIVSLLIVDDFKILFGADINAMGFKTIEKYIPKNIDILKVPHHGAKNTVDDDMLKKLSPKFSVLLTGKNPYDHPYFETVNKLRKYSIILSTAQLNAIKFKLNKNTLTLNRFNPKTNRFEVLETF